MEPTATEADDGNKPTPAPALVAGSCAQCWAAKYCAVFSLAGPQPPTACPLMPRPPARPKPKLYDTEF